MLAVNLCMGTQVYSKWIDNSRNMLFVHSGLAVIQNADTQPIYHTSGAIKTEELVSLLDDTNAHTVKMIVWI